MGMLLRRHLTTHSGEPESASAPNLTVLADVAPESTPEPSLREQADALGIKYHPNIGDEKLSAKIAEAKAGESE